MAVGAHGGFVLAEKRERVKIVVKPYLLLPRCFIVAARAPFALRALMRIICLVAVDAGGSRQRFRHGFDMAGRARRLCMSAAQRKFGPGVVKTDIFPGAFRVA